MPSRQSRPPRQWLIVGPQSRAELRMSLRALPRGSAVLILRGSLPAGERRPLRRIAPAKGWVIVEEGTGEAKRVHNIRELRHAMIAMTPFVMLSPLFPTRSHPDWRPLPRMRAAALARLGGRRLIALGGMDEAKFRRIERLGFAGWAGIRAWLRT